jgi:hypothetical protein
LSFKNQKRKNPEFLVDVPAAIQANIQFPGWSLGVVKNKYAYPDDSLDLGAYTHYEPQEPAPFGLSWLEFYNSPLTREQDACLSPALAQRKQNYMSHHPLVMFQWEEARYFQEYQDRVVKHGRDVAKLWLEKVQARQAETWEYQNSM